MRVENQPVWDTYRPGKEPYVGARLLESLPYVFGEKGKFVVGLFAYLRWVDDTVDEGEKLTRVQKLEFLDQQMRLTTGFTPDDVLPMEGVFCELPWKCVPEKEVRHRINIILGSVVDDVNHQGFMPRTDREIRHYNWRTVWPVFDGLFLIINGKPMRENSSFMRLLDAYMRMGSLEGLGDDLQQRVLKLPVAKTTDYKAAEDVLDLWNKKWFDDQKWDSLKTMASNIGAILDLDIPTWQKLVFVAYVGEVLLKKSVMVNRNRAVRNLSSGRGNVGALGFPPQADKLP